VAAEPGFLSLSLCETASTIATFSNKWKTGRFKDYVWNSLINVPVTTLDLLIHEFGVPKFCKIDVEGYEYQVIQGLTSPVPFLSFEFTKEFLEEAWSCMKYLESLGEVRFNYTHGEKSELALSQWIDSRTLFDELQRKMDNLFWGDIYAGFRMNVDMK
jgi:hypothetical protein